MAILALNIGSMGQIVLVRVDIEIMSKKDYRILGTLSKNIFWPLEINKEMDINPKTPH